MKDFLEPFVVDPEEESSCRSEKTRDTFGRYS